MCPIWKEVRVDFVFSHNIARGVAHQRFCKSPEPTSLGATLDPDLSTSHGCRLGARLSNVRNWNIGAEGENNLEPKMQSNQKLSSALVSRARSFRDAGNGLVSLIITEPNARIHVGAATIVIIAGLSVGLPAADWRWIVLLIGLVWASEAINTSLEHLCDVVTLEKHEGIRIAKDVAAGAVLIVAITSGIIGLMIFLPFLI